MSKGEERLETYSSTLSKLLNSKAVEAQFFGVAIALLFLGPPIFQTIGHPSLTVWERAERITVAIGQWMVTVAAAAINPKALGVAEEEQR